MAEPANARQNEYLAMLGRYERLRLAGRCPAALREKLKTEQADFHLVEAADGSANFMAVDYLAHKVTGLADGSDSWTVGNRHAAQPLKLRIDALYSVEPYDGLGGRVLADFAAPGEFVAQEAADGVTQTFQATAEPSKSGKPSGRYSAASTRKTPQGAWCRASKVFNPPLDLNPFDALGVWIHGDGKGELLNLQLTNPTQFWPTFDEHYVKVDFRGWRYFELLARERDADQYADYAWPYQDVSAVYRSPLIHDHVSALNLWFNRVPPGGEATCCLGADQGLADDENPAEEPGSYGRRERDRFPGCLGERLLAGVRVRCGLQSIRRARQTGPGGPRVRADAGPGGRQQSDEVPLRGGSRSLAASQDHRAQRRRVGRQDSGEPLILARGEGKARMDIESYPFITGPQTRT